MGSFEPDTYKLVRQNHTLENYLETSEQAQCGSGDKGMSRAEGREEATNKGFAVIVINSSLFLTCNLLLMTSAGNTTHQRVMPAIPLAKNLPNTPTSSFVPPGGFSASLVIYRY